GAGARRQLLADEGLAGGRLDGHLLGGRVAHGLLLEDHLGAAQEQLVAVAEQPLADALVGEEGPVQATEVPVEELARRLLDDLGVLLRNDAIEDLDGVVGVAPDAGDGTELVLSPPLGALDDDLGHALLEGFGVYHGPLGLTPYQSTRAASVSARGAS